MQNFCSAFDLGSVQDAMNGVALYLTIAIALLLSVFGILVRAFRKNSFKGYLKIALPSFVGYAVGILALFFTVKVLEYDSEGYLDATFWLVAGFFLAAVALTVVGAAIWTVKRKHLKLYTKISVALLTVYALAVLIYRMVLDFKSGEFDQTTQILLYVFTAAIVAVLFAVVFFFGKKRPAPPTKVIAFGGVTVATSFALSYIRFFELPQGGSITLASLLPVMVFAYLFGMRKGLLVGALYGLLQFIQAPWFYHPMQFLLDYPIAFAAIALAGLFKELKLFEKIPAVQFLLGALCAAVFRYFAHVISGIYVFGSGDPENYSAVAWSFLYNAFVFADMAATVAAGALLFTSKSFLHQLELTARSVRSAQKTGAEFERKEVGAEHRKTDSLSEIYEYDDKKENPEP